MDARQGGAGLEIDIESKKEIEIESSIAGIEIGNSSVDVRCHSERDFVIFHGSSKLDRSVCCRMTSSFAIICLRTASKRRRSFI